MTNHEKILEEAKKKFPEATSMASALGKLSLEVFEELTLCQDIGSKEYEVLRKKYFQIRSAYEHEYFNMTSDSNFLKMDSEFAYGKID